MIFAISLKTTGWPPMSTPRPLLHHSSGYYREHPLGLPEFNELEGSATVELGERRREEATQALRCVTEPAEPGDLLEPGEAVLQRLTGRQSVAHLPGSTVLALTSRSRAIRSRER